jgi:hypothetical protein
MYVVLFAVLCVSLVLLLCALARAVAPFFPGLLIIVCAVVAALSILPADNHPHEASPVAGALLALMVVLFIFIIVRGIIRSLMGVRAVPRVVPRAGAPRRLISAREPNRKDYGPDAVAGEVIPPVKAAADPEIEALKLKLKLELERAEPPWLGYRPPPK